MRACDAPQCRITVAAPYYSCQSPVSVLTCRPGPDIAIYAVKRHLAALCGVVVVAHFNKDGTIVSSSSRVSQFGSLVSLAQTLLI